MREVLRTFVEVKVVIEWFDVLKKCDDGVLLLFVSDISHRANPLVTLLPLPLPLL